MSRISTPDAVVYLLVCAVCFLTKQHLKWEASVHIQHLLSFWSSQLHSSKKLGTGITFSKIPACFHFSCIIIHWDMVKNIPMKADYLGCVIDKLSRGFRVSRVSYLMWRSIYWEYVLRFDWLESNQCGTGVWFFIYVYTWPLSETVKKAVNAIITGVCNSNLTVHTGVKVGYQMTIIAGCMQSCNLPQRKRLPVRRCKHAGNYHKEEVVPFK